MSEWVNHYTIAKHRTSLRRVVRFSILWCNKIFFYKKVYILIIYISCNTKPNDMIEMSEGFKLIMCIWTKNLTTKIIIQRKHRVKWFMNTKKHSTPKCIYIFLHLLSFTSFFNQGGFHLHLLVFPFVYQFNSRIGVLVRSSFANN